jgi:hypothetical protein
MLAGLEVSIGRPCQGRHFMVGPAGQPFRTVAPYHPHPKSGGGVGIPSVGRRERDVVGTHPEAVARKLINAWVWLEDTDILD